MSGFITGLKSVEEVEAGIFEVVVTLQRGATAKLRMNTFTFQAFVDQVHRGAKAGALAGQANLPPEKVLCALWPSRERQ